MEGHGQARPIDIPPHWQFDQFVEIPYAEAVFVLDACVAQGVCGTGVAFYDDAMGAVAQLQHVFLCNG